jgi:superfamily II DNA or RNA helicase
MDPLLGDQADDIFKQFVDEKLLTKLQQHQSAGVVFILRCILGLQPAQQGTCGAILADGMGLGKTMQSIATMSILFRAGICLKSVVVCPASLVLNWSDEFEMWLGKDFHIVVAHGTQAATKFQEFECDHRIPVLVTSYETLISNVRRLNVAALDLLVCDEAHKLKNGSTAIARMIRGLCKRRLLITGTPVQNNSEEFYELMDLANPMILSTKRSFLKSVGSTGRQSREDGCARAHVMDIVSQVVLARKHDAEAHQLPGKQTYNVFVTLSHQQKEHYQRVQHEHIQNSKLVSLGKSGTSRSSTRHLNDARATLQKLLHICNRGHHMRPNEREALTQTYQQTENATSGKLYFLETLLLELSDARDREKVVIVSNFTTMLDIIGRMCEDKRWHTLRIDGKSSKLERRAAVKSFNDANNQEAFVFLLSSKAGGCGLNLIGASRLVMFDPDWNPANDLQAMARTWRKGQLRNCVTYRVLSTGTVEETIHQRQLSKTLLAAALVPKANGIAGRQSETHRPNPEDSHWFRGVKLDSCCSTHESLNCNRCVSTNGAAQLDGATEEDVSGWSHHPTCHGVADKALSRSMRRLQDEGQGGVRVSYVMGYHVEGCTDLQPKTSVHTGASRHRGTMASPPLLFSDDEADQKSQCQASFFTDEEDEKPSAKRSRPVFIDGEEEEEPSAKRSRPVFTDEEEEEPLAKMLRPVFTDEEEEEPSTKRSPTQASLPSTCSLMDIALWAKEALPLRLQHHLVTKSRGKQLRLFTMCSGSEIPAVVLQTLSSCLGFSLQHVAACENDSRKQRWIRANFPSVGHLFRDLCDLSATEAFCVLADGRVAVPDADIVVCGFSCRPLRCPAQCTPNQMFANIGC